MKRILVLILLLSASPGCTTVRMYNDVHFWAGIETPYIPFKVGAELDLKDQVLDPEKEKQKNIDQLDAYADYLSWGKEKHE